MKQRPSGSRTTSSSSSLFEGGATSNNRHLSPARTSRTRGKRRTSAAATASAAASSSSAPLQTHGDLINRLHQQWRQSRWFVESIVLIGLVMMGLLISAIRIASNTSQTVPTRSITPNNKKRSWTGEPPTTPPAPPRAPSPITAKDVDSAVKEALKDTWNLPPDPVTSMQAGEDGITPPKAGTGQEVSAARSLDELYQSMEELGLSVDDLTEALNDAYRDA